MEVEEGERLPFLGVESFRSNGTLKKNCSERTSILNFWSHHNYRIKIGLLRSMIIRSLRLTDAEFWVEELENLTGIFLGNGYLSEVIQRNIRAVKSRWQNGDFERTVRTMKDSQKWIFLPSCELTQNLRPILSKWNIQVAMKEKSTLFTSLPNWNVQEVTVYHAAAAERNILAKRREKLAHELRNIRGYAGKWIPNKDP
ncbi:unnamed protein product [Protopolystoma xenopodis]|uniref:Helix-turn-helix domain-containing protein n=1 Tax=Protopolystoma xenopodis TaxID=117903 RepID=A0A3S5CGR5_9PLAT|nr:unnamed protein product [Protopolystoma xenopodis]